MTGTIGAVRELDIRYKPLRLPMPVRNDISGPREAARLAAAVLVDVTVEKVIALHVNTKHWLIGVQVVSVGTLNESLVHPRLCCGRSYVAQPLEGQLRGGLTIHGRNINRTRVRPLAVTLGSCQTPRG
jgi:hypothetical protein